MNSKLLQLFQNFTAKRLNDMHHTVKEKCQVYLNEYNILMDVSTYFPFVSGILKSYAVQFPLIVANYQFEPFLFFRDNLNKIIQQYKNPSIAAFSVSMWNEQLSLEVAKAIKGKFPDCLVIFGGPQVPQQAEGYFRQNPFIDVTVRGEGEEAFSEILIRSLETKDFADIAGISFRDSITKKCVKNTKEREQSKDLDIYPSPYLTGCFDYLIKEWPHIKFQAIIETNRGCPFPCAFCFWGQGGLSRRYRFHGLERVKEIIDWCGKNQIEYLFNADSNFGMHPRDYQIAEFLVESKKKHGFPDKFRTCFGKNTDEKIYQVAKLLHSYKLEKGITLARQSNDPTTLKNINRQNIKLQTYKNLQFRFNDAEIPVYTELILGLPGETVQSWKAGIDEILNSGIRNQLFVYHAQVYPNTEFGDEKYQKQFQMQITRIPLNEIHGAIRPGYLVTEYEDVVTSTASLSQEDWKRLTVFSWVMQVFHSLKLAYYIMIYLHEQFKVCYSDFLSFISEKNFSSLCPILRREIEIFEQRAEDLLKGQGRCQILLQYGDIYWDEDEASFFRLTEDLPAFYEEFLLAVQEFLNRRSIPYSPQELEQVFEYQRIRIPPQNGTSLNETCFFTYNLPEFFEKSFTSHEVRLVKHPQILKLADPKDFHGNQKEYAHQTILWGRKSGTIMQPVCWFPGDVEYPQTEIRSSKPTELSII